MNIKRNWPEWLACIFIILCIICLFILTDAMVEAKGEFLAECTADGMKKYQCEALWNDSQN